MTLSEPEMGSDVGGGQPQPPPSLAKKLPPRGGRSSAVEHRVEQHKRSVPLGLLRRETGSFHRCPAPPRPLQWAAEEKLIEKNHEEFECVLPESTRSTFLMVFSPDGKMVASTHGNHNVYVTDLRSGRNVKTLIGHPRTPWCIAFHPSSNQILASGCLGGQVRVWDLHGGSEIWTAESQTVIASLAFHPTDRVLVIASYNEIHFWDWSQQKPFAKCRTANEREKVRYVGFACEGGKLVTGIANAPSRPVSQWDRVAAPQPPPQPSQSEHERRITICYRYMVEQYQQLIDRYYRLSSSSSTSPPAAAAPTMDRGTDPIMPPEEPLPTTPTTGPTTSTTNRCAVCRRTSNNNTNDSPEAGPSTSADPPSVVGSGGSSRGHHRHLTGTDEVIASHSSSQFMLERNATHAPGEEGSSDPTTPLRSQSSSSDPLAFRANYLFERLSRLRSQVETGRTILAQTRTAAAAMSARMSPSAPEEAGFLIDRSPFDPRIPVSGYSGHTAPTTPDITAGESPTFSNRGLTPTRQRLLSLSGGLRTDDSTSSSDTSLSDGVPTGGTSWQRPITPPPTTGGQLLSQRLTNISQPVSSRRVVFDTSPSPPLPPGLGGTGGGSGGRAPPSHASPPPPPPPRLWWRDLWTSPTSGTSTSNTSRSLSEPTNGSDSDPDSGNLFLRRNTNDNFSHWRVFLRYRYFRDSGSNTEPLSESNSSDSNSSNLRRNFESSFPAIVARLRSQFRRLQSAYSIRDREPPLLREAAENAERRLLTRLSNLLERPLPSTSAAGSSAGRAAATGGTSFTSAAPAPPPPRLGATNANSDLESVRFGIELLGRHIENLSNQCNRVRLEVSEVRRMWDELESRIFTLQAAILRGGGGTASSTGDSWPLAGSATSPAGSVAGGFGRSPRRNAASPRDLGLFPTSASLRLSEEVGVDGGGGPLVSGAGGETEGVASTSSLPTDEESEDSGFLFSQPARQLGNRRFRFLHRPAYKRPRFDRHPRLSRRFSQGTSRDDDSDEGDEEERGEAGGGVGGGSSSGGGGRGRGSSLSGGGGGASDGGDSTRGVKRKSSDPSPQQHCTASPESPRGRGPGAARLRTLTRHRFPQFSRFRSLSHFNFSPSRERNSGNSRDVNPGNAPDDLMSSRNRSGSSASRESIRNRARHVLLLMVDSLTQFFENDIFTRFVSNENLQQRIPNLISLLEMALNLTGLLLTQLDISSRETGGRSGEGTGWSTGTTGGGGGRGRGSAGGGPAGGGGGAGGWQTHGRASTSSSRGGGGEAGEGGASSAGGGLTGHRRRMYQQFQQYHRRVESGSTPPPDSWRSPPSRTFTESLGWSTGTTGGGGGRGRGSAGGGPAGGGGGAGGWQTHGRASTSSSRGGGGEAGEGGASSAGGGLTGHRRRMYQQFQQYHRRVESGSTPPPDSWRSPPSRTFTESLGVGGGGGRLPVLRVNDGPVPAEPSSPSSLPEAPPPLPAFPGGAGAGGSGGGGTAGGGFSRRFLHPRYHRVHQLLNEDSSEESSHDRSDLYFLTRGGGGSASMLLSDTPLAPHHRIQAWDFSEYSLPDIHLANKNIVVSECKVHNDASVDISCDGKLLVTLLPSGRLCVTTMIGVYSLEWDSLGQCLYTTTFDLNAVSVSLSPTSRHLLVGLAARRVHFIHTDRQTFAQIFRLEGGRPSKKNGPSKGRLVFVRDLETSRELSTDFMSLNCIRWAPVAGEAFVYGTNTGKLKILR